MSTSTSSTTSNCFFGPWYYFVFSCFFCLTLLSAGIVAPITVVLAVFCLLSASTMSSCLASLVIHSWCTVSTSSWCFDIWQLRRPLEVLWAYSAPDAWEKLQYCREVSNWPAVQKYYIFASFMTPFVLTCVIQSWWVPAVTCNHLFVVPGIHEVISVFFQEVPIVLLFLPETCCWMSALWCWLVLGHCFGLLSGPTQLNSGWVCTSLLFFFFNLPLPIKTSHGTSLTVATFIRWLLILSLWKFKTKNGKICICITP